MVLDARTLHAAPHAIRLAALPDGTATRPTRFHRKSRLDEARGLGLEELFDAATVRARVPGVLAESRGMLAELDGDPREQDDQSEECVTLGSRLAYYDHDVRHMPEDVPESDQWYIDLVQRLQGEFMAQRLTIRPDTTPR